MIEAPPNKSKVISDDIARLFAPRDNKESLDAIRMALEATKSLSLEEFSQKSNIMQIDCTLPANIRIEFFEKPSSFSLEPTTDAITLLQNIIKSKTRSSAYDALIETAQTAHQETMVREAKSLYGLILVQPFLSKNTFDRDLVLTLNLDESCQTMENSIWKRCLNFGLNSKETRQEIQSFARELVNQLERGKTEPQNFEGIIQSTFSEKMRSMDEKALKNNKDMPDAAYVERLRLAFINNSPLEWESFSSEDFSSIIYKKAVGLSGANRGFPSQFRAQLRTAIVSEMKTHNIRINLSFQLSPVEKIFQFFKFLPRSFDTDRHLILRKIQIEFNKTPDAKEKMNSLEDSVRLTPQSSGAKNPAGSPRGGHEESAQVSPVSLLKGARANSPLLRGFSKFKKSARK